MSLRFIHLALLLALSACAAPAAAPPSATAPLPANVRPDLDRQWLDQAGAIRWPASDGFSASPVPIVLPAGVMIDRFGNDNGRFFSPKGASYRGRALPYVCEALAYTTFRITQPLLAWSGKAAAWFGEPGGATQLQTDATAAQLVADHVIEKLPTDGTTPCGKN
jgi:hypothetical protein